jgi:hypothetical protein
MWENLPFSKGGTFALVFGSAFVGTALVLVACFHQQKKHGFST